MIRFCVPLMKRRRSLELLGRRKRKSERLAAQLSMDKARVFAHLLDLVKRNMVEIAGFDERHPVFKKRW